MTVLEICQAWVNANFGDECFWEGFADCPSPQNDLTPNMVIAEIARLTAENGSLKGSLLVMEEGYQRLTAERDQAQALAVATFKRSATNAALATGPGTTALAEIVKQAVNEETQKCIEAYPKGIGALTARLDNETNKDENSEREVDLPPIHRFAVLFGDNIRGSYSNEAKAVSDAEKLGLSVIEIRPVRMVTGKSGLGGAV